MGERLHRLLLTILVLLWAGGITSRAALADEIVAQCRGITVSTTSGGRVRVSIGEHSFEGALAAVAKNAGARALTLVGVTADREEEGWSGDTTVIVFDGYRRGLIVLRDQGTKVHEESDGSRRHASGEGACIVGTARLPDAVAQRSCRERAEHGFRGDDKGVTLTPEARELLCQTHDRLLRERARFGLALAAFLEARERARTTSATEPFERSGSLAARLLDACVDFQEVGVSTHNQGLALWPEFSAAQCYRHLVQVLDPAKEWTVRDGK